MRKVELEFILKKWLKNRIDSKNYIVHSFELESDLVQYGKDYWDRIATPSSYSRTWRHFKSSTRIDDIDLKTIQPINNGKTYTSWKLETGI
tara:strand:- start:21152 stop:21424 length:273 start_codon:yes stop_codon:yes gene_type:complete